jgi:hypothetical protein
MSQSAKRFTAKDANKARKPLTANAANFTTET